MWRTPDNNPSNADTYLPSFLMASLLAAWTIFWFWIAIGFVGGNRERQTRHTTKHYLFRYSYNYPWHVFSWVLLRLPYLIWPPSQRRRIPYHPLFPRLPMDRQRSFSFLFSSRCLLRRLSASRPTFGLFAVARDKENILQVHLCSGACRCIMYPNQPLCWSLPYRLWHFYLFKM